MRGGRGKKRGDGKVTRGERVRGVKEKEEDGKERKRRGEDKGNNIIA